MPKIHSCRPSFACWQFVLLLTTASCLLFRPVRGQVMMAEEPSSTVKFSLVMYPHYEGSDADPVCHISTDGDLLDQSLNQRMGELFVQEMGFSTHDFEIGYFAEANYCDKPVCRNDNPDFAVVECKYYCTLVKFKGNQYSSVANVNQIISMDQIGLLQTGLIDMIRDRMKEGHLSCLGNKYKFLLELFVSVERVKQYDFGVVERGT